MLQLDAVMIELTQMLRDFTAKNLLNTMWAVIGIIVASIYIIKWLLRKLTVGQYGNRYVFITGCDSGFGNLLAKTLDKLGCHVFAGCFTEKSFLELKKTSSLRLLTVELDVTNDTSIKKAVRFVKSNLPPGKGLWGLVNNAGIAGPSGMIEWMTKRDFITTLDVNLFGMIEVTNAFLPFLRRERGRVVNMASVMGRIAAASAPYVISKYGVEAYSDCLRRQVRKTGVTVHILEPGFFKTPLTDIDGINASVRRCYDRADPDVTRFYGEEFVKHIQETVTKRLISWASPDLHIVVDGYIHALTARFPKTRYVLGWEANYMFRPMWNLPTWLCDRMMTHANPTPAALKKC